MASSSSSSSSSSTSTAPQFRSRFGDTTRTKVFVGGLAWEITSAELHRHFAQFGDILEAIVIADRTTGRSKGYGFVTFREPDSASRAVAEPNPMIGSRRANCNIAAQRRPRPPPPPPPGPPGMNQHGGVFEGSVGPRFNRVPVQVPLPPLMYPHNMGYPTYHPDYAYQHALIYAGPQMNQQYYQQILGVYGPGSSPALGPQPFPYAYAPSPRGSFRSQLGGPRAPYTQYPTAQMDGSFERSFSPPHNFQLQLPPRARQHVDTTGNLRFHFELGVSNGLGGTWAVRPGTVAGRAMIRHNYCSNRSGSARSKSLGCTGPKICGPQARHDTAHIEPGPYLAGATARSPARHGPYYPKV